MESSYNPESSSRPGIITSNLSRQGSLRRRVEPLPSPGGTVHPLAGLVGEHKDRDGDDTDGGSDISRPTLRRLTSETERQVAESSRSGGASQSEGGSARGSLDLLRMTPKEGSSGEVEVLVHHVKATESLAGIALLYGIDLPTLRKINKLWTSDPVHLRKHLYVPIEACKWNKASETFIRGPGPGQITLVPKTSSSRKGKTPIRSRSTSLSTSHQPFPSTSHTPATNGLEGLGLEEDGWGEMIPSPAKDFLENTNDTYDRGSLDSIRPSAYTLEDDSEDVEPEQRIVDVVRIPHSQLRFFPRPQKPPDTERRSLDYDMRRVSLEGHVRRSSTTHIPSTNSKLNSSSLGRRASGPSIQNDLHTLPPPLQSTPSSNSQKSGMVKIRPAISSTVNMSSIVPELSSAVADKFTSFFKIPPPPNQKPSYSSTPNRGFQMQRPGLPFVDGGGANGSRRSLDTSLRRGSDIPLEMTRGLRDARPKVKTNKKLD